MATIRRATAQDIEGLERLLYQVHQTHANGRPDIFQNGKKKYNREQLLKILADDTTPVFVAVDPQNKVLGYAFCVYEEVKDHPSMTDRKSLYIDDLCVDAAARRQHIGSSLYEYVLAEAKQNQCYHVTLNVWCLNESALSFYRSCGLTPLKITMEKILE